MAGTLENLVRRFSVEVALMRRLFVNQVPQNPWRGIWFETLPMSAQSYAIIRLHDAWARFCRNLILTSAVGNTRTTTGQYVSPVPGVNNRYHALARLKGTYPRQRQGYTVWEPKWFDPSDALDAATRLGITNGASVMAIGSAGVALEDLRICRNFLAHRSAITNRAIDQIRRRLGVPIAISVEELANAIVPGGASLFELWCYELHLKAANAAK